ncbi:hypothetical protein MRB53_038741 [Persea americana]|nr:hypothetical protein MRB53_038741 [Persea americana]
MNLQTNRTIHEVKAVKDRISDDMSATFKVLRWTAMSTMPAMKQQSSSCDTIVAVSSDTILQVAAESHCASDSDDGNDLSSPVITHDASISKADIYTKPLSHIAQNAPNAMQTILIIVMPTLNGRS